MYYVSALKDFLPERIGTLFRIVLVRECSPFGGEFCLLPPPKGPYIPSATPGRES
jgi:hypothetical protein